MTGIITNTTFTTYWTISSSTIGIVHNTSDTNIINTTFTANWTISSSTIGLKQERTGSITIHCDTNIINSNSTIQGT